MSRSIIMNMQMWADRMGLKSFDIEKAMVEYVGRYQSDLRWVLAIVLRAVVENRGIATGATARAMAEFATTVANELAVHEDVVSMELANDAFWTSYLTTSEKLKIRNNITGHEDAVLELINTAVKFRTEAYNNYPGRTTFTSMAAKEAKDTMDKIKAGGCGGFIVAMVMAAEITAAGGQLSYDEARQRVEAMWANVPAEMPEAHKRRVELAREGTRPLVGSDLAELFIDAERCYQEHGLTALCESELDTMEAAGFIHTFNLNWLGMDEPVNSIYARLRAAM